MSYLLAFANRLNHVGKIQGHLGHLEQQRAWLLIAELVLIYIGFAAFFAIFYWKFELVQEADVEKYFDYFYFSFITQSTIGYGDLKPIEGGRILVIFQAMIGIILIATGTGIIIVKILLPRRDSITFDEYLIYNPIKNKFTVRMVNRLPFPLYLVEIDMRLRHVRVTQRGETKTSRKKILLFRDKITTLPSLRPFLSSTKPIGEFKGATALKIGQDLTLEPSHIPSGSEITITLKSQYFAGTSVITKTYKSDRIKCGFYSSTYDGDGPVDWNKWNVHQRATEVHCIQCGCLEMCELR